MPEEKINTEEGGKVEEKSSCGRPARMPDERIALQSSSFESTETFSA
jgi:hypothetical protein